jgi:hypothetical protein
MRDLARLCETFRWAFRPMILRGAVRPAPELLAVTQERSWWRRLLRTAWCLYLLLTGQLSVAVRSAPRLRPSPSIARFSYVTPLAQAVRRFMHGVPAPPLFA